MRFEYGQIQSQKKIMALASPFMLLSSDPLLIISRYLRNRDYRNFHLVCKKFSTVKGTKEEEFVRKCSHGSHGNFSVEVFWKCCEDGHIYCVKHLFQSGLTLENARAEFNGEFLSELTLTERVHFDNALDLSIHRGHFKIVKYLFSSCLTSEGGLTLGDVRACNNWAFLLSVKEDFIEIVKLLVSLGLTLTDVRARNNWALRNSACYGHLEKAAACVEDLRGHGQDSIT